MWKWCRTLTAKKLRSMFELIALSPVFSFDDSAQLPEDGARHVFFKKGTMMSSQKEYNQTVIAEFRADGGKVADFATTPLLLLTTVGARSGQPRITPLAYTTDGNRFIVIASD